MFFPGYGPIAITDWSIIGAMPSIGQTLILASIGAIVEMGILSTLKRLLMESTVKLCSHISFMPNSLFNFSPSSIPETT
jgi:hypothetical protein